jgi:hypothetical protein
MNDSAAIEARQIEANAMRATVAIRVVREGGAGLTRRRYQGEVYGPLASDRTTLPASYRVPEFSEGEEARAVVTDPCFWSPDAPLEYEILLTSVGEGAEQSETLRRTIRLRTRSELT